MSDEQVEVIDTSQMQVLSEFAAAGWVHANTDRFRLGVLGDNIIIAGHGLDGTWSGDTLFERKNLEAVTKLLGEVLNGRLYDEDQDYLNVISGKDEAGISAQAPRGKITISLYNNRRVKMDGAEANSWNITVAPDTALSLYVELKELIAQGKV
jgi:hypothetical protein